MAENEQDKDEAKAAAAAEKEAAKVLGKAGKTPFTITGHVRHGGETYAAGQEEALGKILTPVMRRRLLATGAITLDAGEADGDEGETRTTRRAAKKTATRRRR
jgi:hypothetical protein